MNRNQNLRRKPSIKKDRTRRQPSRSKPPRTCFLVGAGLVYDAGLPLSVGLSKNFREYLSEQAERESNSTGVAHLEVYRYLNGAIRYQQGVLNRDPEAPVNIEQIATAALRLRQRLDHPLAPHVSAWSQRILELENRHQNILSSFLEVIYRKLNDWLAPPEDRTKIEYLTRFADFRDEQGGLSIFSLNYDLCIEQAVADLGGVGVVNGFSEAGWNMIHFERNDALRLFKLHGSLDWVEDQAYGICSTEFPRHTSAEDFEENMPPLLIFGTDTKLTGKDPFLTLLYSFASKLTECEVLIVIGYSFGDEYLNEIIEQRLRTNTALRLIVVSPNASKMVTTIQFLNGSPRVQTIDASAKTALTDGLVRRAWRELLTSATDEMPF